MDCSRNVKNLLTCVVGWLADALFFIAWRDRFLALLAGARIISKLYIKHAIMSIKTSTLIC